MNNWTLIMTRYDIQSISWRQVMFSTAEAVFQRECVYRDQKSRWNMLPVPVVYIPPTGICKVFEKDHLATRLTDELNLDVKKTTMEK